MSLFDSHINKSRQRIVVCCGLEVVEINNCRIEDISGEGILIRSRHWSEASSIESGLEELRANLPEYVARRGVEMGDGTLLEVKFVKNAVKGCRFYGLVLDDMDANVSIVNSKLVDNGPAACYVQVNSFISIHCYSLGLISLVWNNILHTVVK